MRMQEEQIRNVAKIFEAFTRAIEKRDDIKIEYLDCDGEIHEIYIDINKSNSLKFSFDSGYIDISYDEDLRFNSNITDIQSVTTFRTTKLKFREVNKK
jgi:hypothetical protein